jgi:hypothetical protein
MNARERLAETLRNPGLVGLDKEEADELIDDLLREHTAEVFAPIWTMAVEYVRDHPSPVRPDEEPT